MKENLGRYIIWLNIALFSMATWYCVAELLLSLVWQKVWH